MSLSAAERLRPYRAKLKEIYDIYEAIKDNDGKRNARKNWYDKTTARET